MRPDLVAIIEAILFSSSNPVLINDIVSSLNETFDDVKDALIYLKNRYESDEYGVQLKEIAGGWKIFTKERYYKYIEKFVTVKSKRFLSKASLETLSIIAYNQPITKAQIQAIRGKQCESCLSLLLEENLIAIKGKENLPGRPYLYVTTDKFLERFGLASLDDLPPVEEIDEIFFEKQDKQDEIL